MQAVLKETEFKLKNQQKVQKDFLLKTLYFGGGTPGLLNGEDFLKLAKPFQNYLAEEYEWTIELNPDSMTEEKLFVYKKAGVNRLSIGIQSFDDRILKKIGRKHDSKTAVQAIKLAKKTGFDNISADLIYGLPDQSMECLKKDIESFLQLDIPHISIYSLQIEEDSVFGKQHLKPIDEDLEADMFEYICFRLKNAGYTHYEISSFAKNNQFSKHNLAYWSDEDFLGIGWGASEKKDGRFEHANSLKEYLKDPLCSIYVENSKEDAAFEAIMMSLRSVFGLDIEKWNEKYKRNFQEEYENVLKKYIPNYLKLEKNRLTATEKGMEILNTILVDFL